MAVGWKGSTVVIEQSRKRLLSWFKPAWIKNDDGVAALLVAAAIAVIAFTALSIFLNKIIGNRELARIQSGAGAQARVLPAIFTYYLGDVVGPPAASAPHALPCPDTKATPDGKHTGTCTGTGNYVGVIPWVDLGLSRSEVIDAYGNFYTYVVSGPANGVCESITKSYATTGGGTQEFTGRLTTPALEARLTSQASGEGRLVPFAIIGHGLNGTGALTAGGHITSTPDRAGEQANAASTGNASPPTAIFTGPADTDTTSTTYFDDQVLAPATSDVQKVCAQLTPGGQINAALSDGFDSTGTTTKNFGALDPTTPANGVTLGTSADGRNKYAALAATGAATTYLATDASNFNFAPRVRPVYISAQWTASASTISIATRATANDLNPGTDDFSLNGSNGITFRFSSAGISIKNDGVTLSTTVHSTSSTSPAFTVTAGQTYTLEVYDNGTELWSRISSTTDPTNYSTTYATADATAHGTTGDTGGEQRAFLINGAAASQIDNVAIGFPMLSLETNGTDSYATATGNGTATRRLTLEAWVKPRAFPTGTGSHVNGSIIAKWNTASAATANSFRLRVNSGGNIYFDAATEAGSGKAVESFKGPSLAVNTWSHIAVTYTFHDDVDDTKDTETVSFFKDGDQVSGAVSNPTGPAGINITGAPNFYVGADLNSAAIEDEFTGDISDVRVWKEARTPRQIRDNFQARLTADGTDTALDDLIVNWRLDSESGGLDTAAATAANTPSNKGNAGTITAANYVPSLAKYFRPLSTSFCPSGTIAGAYECDFRTSAQSTSGTTRTLTVPGSLLSLYAKVWGAGGGGYNATNTSVGGGGGYSGGVVSAINGTSISNTQLSVFVGGAGTTSTTANFGGGGGGASGVLLYHATNVIPGLIAGGGGGASYSAGLAVTAAGLGQIQTIIDALLAILNGGNPFTFSQGGTGGGGGGASAVAVRAFDSKGTCGGLNGTAGAFGTNPTTATYCAAGGNAPSGTPPITGGGSASGGSPGGYNTYTLNDLVGFTQYVGGGFGGGGGAGFADSAGIANAVGTAAASTGVSTGTAANATDYYYSPPTFVTPYTPGRGGVTSGNAASDGAVILIW